EDYLKLKLLPSFLEHLPTFRSPELFVNLIDVTNMGINNCIYCYSCEFNNEEEFHSSSCPFKKYLSLVEKKDKKYIALHLSCHTFLEKILFNNKYWKDNYNITTILIQKVKKKLIKKVYKISKIYPTNIDFKIFSKYSSTRYVY
ncbi:hypothetical protein MXB_4755, partial [Myxobolus squamalis]